MKKIFLSFTLLVGTLGFSQVLIDDTGATTGTPDASAVLDLTSETRGLLLPRLGGAPANPVEGLVYYDTVENCFKGYTEGAWYPLGGVCSTPNTPPVASNVAISGDVNVGETLTPSYDYTDADGDAESGTTYEWIALINGSETSLSTDSSYTLPTTSEGFEIKLCVTPNDGTDAGTTECSQYYTIGAALPAIARINEINYDTPGADTGEFVEVRATLGTDLTGVYLESYNGATGLVDDTFMLSATPTLSDANYDYYVILTQGIQNGAPDGLALVESDGTLVEFLSYEGSFTGANGSANGITSTDIGIAQDGATTNTAQRSDDGTSWFLSPTTQGAANVQVIPVPEVQFLETVANVTENGGTYTITLEVANPGNEDITVNVSTVETGATATDYTVDMPASFTIPAGSTSATYTFTGVDDADEDAGESVAFTITSVSAATESPVLGTNTNLTVNILDDDTVITACKTDLLFTEYYDGASNNKYIEIYNGTGAVVDMTPYVIELYSNGSPTAGTTLDLQGSIADGATYTIGNSNGSDYTADINSGITFVNGDEILVLKNGATVVDRLGPEGNANNNDWAPTNGVLQRMANAQPNATYTPAEWVEVTLAENTLGSYTCDGGGSPTNQAPVATNPIISDPVVGSVTTFMYDFSDADGDTESGSLYEWKLALDNTGDSASAITGADTNTYTPDQTDEGLFLQACVAPGDGTDLGTVVCSPWKEITATVVTPTGCKTDLIISQYVEGSSNNKYIEIYNGTGADVDLTQYQLLKFNSGNTPASNSETLSGTLADGATIVYANSQATIYGGTVTDLNSIVSFNGDDPVAIANTAGDIIDIIGTLNVTENFGQNSTLTRADNAQPTASYDDAQWTSTAVDDITGLGDYTCSGGSTPTNPVLSITQVDANGDEGNTGTQVVTVTVNLDQIATEDITVGLNYTGTADATDFSAPASVTIANGSNSATFDITVNGDADVESDDTVTVTLGVVSVGSADVSSTTADTNFTYTITNDDVASSTNLVANGSFETGDTTGWDKAESSTVISTDSQEGANAISVTATSTRDLAQVVPVTAGETYTISYWYKIETAAGTDTRIWSFWRTGTSNNSADASSLRPNSYPTSTTWEEVTMTLTAPTGVDNLYFEVRTYSGATVVYDNFSVVQQ